MESSTGTGFPLWQKMAFAFGGLAALAFIGYLVDKPASGDENPKKRPGKRPVHQHTENPVDEGIPAFAQQHLTSNGGPSRHKAKGEPKRRQKISLNDLLVMADQSSRVGDYDRAEEMYSLALTELENLGADIMTISIVTYALALCYRSKHELHNAEEYMLKACTMVEQVFADAPNLEPATVAALIEQYTDILATLSETYLDLERYDKSEDYLTRCFQFVEKKREVIENAEFSTPEEEAAQKEESDKMEKRIAILNDNLTKLRFRQKRLDEAEVQGKKSVDLLRKAYGPTEVLTVQGQMRLAAIYQEKKQWDDANRVYDTIISEHEDSNEEPIKVASLLQFQGHQNLFKEGLAFAEKNILKAIAILDKQFEKSSDDDLLRGLAELLNDLAVIYLNMGRKEESLVAKNKLKEKLQSSNTPAPLPISRHLRTVTASFSYSSPDKLEYLKINYILGLDIATPRFDEKLPDTAMVVYTFENPVEGESPIVVEQPINPGQSTLSVQVPVVKTRQKFYDVEVVIYKDVSKSELISYHYLVVKGELNTEEIKDLEELQTKLYEARTQRRQK